MDVRPDANESFRTTTHAALSPAEAARSISEPERWWGSRFEGSAKDVGDEFTVRFVNGDRYTLRVDAIDDTFIRWVIVDAHQTWVTDPAEWTGTTLEWTLSREGAGVSIELTHLGLTPALECYERCTSGWTYLVSESLSRLLNEGAGRPV